MGFMHVKEVDFNCKVDLKKKDEISLMIGQINAKGEMYGVGKRITINLNHTHTLTNIQSIIMTDGFFVNNDLEIGRIINSNDQ